MVKCPRCGNAVDETTRTTCPACFTPLAAQAAPEENAPDTATPNPPADAASPPAAAPPAMPPAAPPVAPTLPQPVYPQAQMPPQQPVPAPPQEMGRIPGLPQTPPQAEGMPPIRVAPGAGLSPSGRPARVSLTGEIIEDEAPAPPPLNRPAGMPGSPPPLPPRAAGAAARPMPHREAPAKSGGSAATIAAVIVVLALIGVGGWWFLMHRTNPKDQAVKFFTALKAQDWKTVYETAEVDKEQFASAQEFADKTKAEIEKNPQAAQMVTTILSQMEFKTGEAKVNGGEATVPVTFTANLFGQKLNETRDLKMKNFGGIWKISKDNSQFGNIGSGGFGGGGGFGLTQ